jgi:predicted nuclease of predicted toxin-antitoxin system
MNEIRFYLDENIDNDVAKALRGRGIDVLTTAEAGNAGQTDPTQLAFARRERSVIVTQDEDFLILDSQQVPHAGIAYYKHRNRSIKEVIRGLLLIYEVLTVEDMMNHVEFL